MYLSDILHYCHYIVPLSILLLPFLPSKILFYAFAYPIIYYIIWFLFGGCPVTMFTRNNSSHIDGDKNFVQTLFRQVGFNWTNQRADDFMHLVIFTSVILSAYKVIFYYKKKKRS